MNTRLLGRTGIRVSNLCFGTMSFGGAADEATAAAMYHRCREADINFFDCANVYSAGVAEQMLGRLIREERNQLVITSKVGFPMGEDVNDKGLSRRNILASVEVSLKRLDTDRLDVLFVHTFDPDTPMEETLRILDILVRDGKILYTGVSNWAAWQIALSLGISAREGLASFACIQPMYNLVKRQAEVEILPLAASEGLGVISYSPLGGGLLTGKYGTATKPEAGRLVDNTMYAARYGNAQYYETAESFVALARKLDVSPATLAVAWVAAHPAISTPIIGARNLDQLEASLAAADFPMTRELYAEIEALSPTPVPATDRTEEQQGVAYKGSKENYR
ncbi:aldo/keto reductase [Candidatus Bipolaricaulota bacterium]|nr:aldo/keto reductase [Candidatus Bipolaricaulota bacterium]